MYLLLIFNVFVSSKHKYFANKIFWNINNIIRS